MKYHIDYIDKNDDHCHVWVEAENAGHAQLKAKREYHDIKRIIRIRKA